MYPYYEETISDAELEARLNPIPFKIKYVFHKNPCEKCLVRACCLEKHMNAGMTCQEKEIYEKRMTSVAAFFTRTVNSKLNFIFFGISMLLFFLIYIIFNDCYIY